MKKSLSESSYIVQKNFFIKRSSHLICALSGGQDSVLLFCVLLHLKKIYKLKISVVYCHHFWQLQNIYTVKEIWKLTFLFQIPVCLFFAENKLQSEAAARVWRQNKFSRSLEFFHSHTIAIGHTASDRIETALWHIVRGTSPKGLMSLQPHRQLKPNQFNRTQGQIEFYPGTDQQKIEKVECVWGQKLYKKEGNKTIPYFFWNKSLLTSNKFISVKSKRNFCTSPDIKKSCIKHVDVKISSKFDKVCRQSKKNFYPEIPPTSAHFSIVRPLYDFHRCDVNLVINQNTLPRITDQTNQNIVFTRNRIRSEILPLLRYFVNTRSDFHLYTYLQINAGQQNFIDTIVQTLIESYCNIPKSIESLLHLPEALQCECIYQILKSYTSRQVSILQIKNLRLGIENVFHRK